MKIIAEKGVSKKIKNWPVSRIIATVILKNMSN